MQAYAELEKRHREIMTLREAVRVLEWDRSVMMPEEGAAQRTNQMSLLNVRIHGMQTDPAIGDLLEKTNRAALDEWQAANVKMMERLYSRATALPAALVARKIEQSTQTEMIWRKARAESDFASVS